MTALGLIRARWRYLLLWSCGFAGSVPLLVAGGGVPVGVLLCRRGLVLRCCRRVFELEVLVLGGGLAGSSAWSVRSSFRLGWSSFRLVQSSVCWAWFRSGGLLDWCCCYTIAVAEGLCFRWKSLVRPAVGSELYHGGGGNV